MCEVGTLSAQRLRDLGLAVRAEQDRRTRQAVAAAIRAAVPGLVESLLADLSGPAHTVPVLPIHLHT